MRISKSSLMFKATRFIFESPSYSLCVFFWQFVWSCLVIFFMGVFLGGLALVLSVGAATILLSLGAFIDPNWQPWAINDFVKHSLAISACVYFLFGLGVFIEWLGGRARASSNVFTLYREYMESRDSRICPRIEFD